jgi:hypothetical protein
MKTLAFGVIAAFCAYCSFTHIRTQGRAGRALSLRQILEHQPDFVADETLTVITGNEMHTSSSRVAKKGYVYRRDRGVVITVSQPGKTTLAFYARSKEFIEEPVLDELWWTQADNAALFAGRNDVSLEGGGNEVLDGHECLRIKASKRDKATEADKSAEITFYAAKDLRNLVIATEIAFANSRATYRLREVSFDVPEKLFSFPSDYTKTASDPLAQYRFMDFFHLPEVEDFSASSARSSLLTKIQVGSTEKEVYEFLDRSGIGSDGLSSYVRVEEDRAIICRVEYDPNYPGFVKRHFGVLFLLDQEGRLKDIQVKAWLTGL